MNDTVFGKIIKGEIPATKVYEDEKCLAFLDINPVTKGHLLLIPKEQYVWMHEVPDELLAYLFIKTKKLMKTIIKGLGCDYVQIGIVGNEVPHFHIHLIPRFLNEEAAITSRPHTPYANIEEGYEAEIKKLLRNPKLLLPIDVIVLRGTKKVTVTPNEVQKGDVIVDIGPQSVALIGERIQKAKLIVWNGPTGWYEKGFIKATSQLAQMLLDSKAQAIIGGGDTGAVIENILGNKKRKNLFISTGGGATLAYLSNGTLPGIKALG